MVMRMVWCNNDKGEEEAGLHDGNGGDKDGDEEGMAWQCTRRMIVVIMRMRMTMMMMMMKKGRRGNALGDNLGSRESSSGHDALLVTRLHWGKHRQHRSRHHL